MADGEDWHACSDCSGRGWLEPGLAQLIERTAAALIAAGDDQDAVLAAVRPFLEDGLRIGLSPNGLLGRFGTSMKRAGIEDSKQGRCERAVIDATVEDGSGVANGGYGTRAEPWLTNSDGSYKLDRRGARIPTADTRRIELGIESTALPGRPVLSAVDISFSYTKPFLWTEYTNSYGRRVPIADVRMSRNERNPSSPILNYVEWRRGGYVISRQEFGRRGLPQGW